MRGRTTMSANTSRLAKTSTTSRLYCAIPPKPPCASVVSIKARKLADRTASESHELGNLQCPIARITVHRAGLRALTPLIWDHVNPYGRFELDMSARLPLL